VAGINSRSTATALARLTRLTHARDDRDDVA